MSELKKIEAASSGAALVERLRKGIKNEVAINFPGTKDQVVLVPLTCDELQAAQAKAYERFRKLNIEVTSFNSDDFLSELYTQIISVSMRDPSDLSRKKKMFRDANEARRLLLPDERTAITSAYSALMKEANPDPNEMDDETFEQITEYVKKKDVPQLSVYESSTLAIYITSMDSQHAS